MIIPRLWAVHFSDENVQKRNEKFITLINSINGDEKMKNENEKFNVSDINLNATDAKKYLGEGLAQTMPAAPSPANFTTGLTVFSTIHGFGNVVSITKIGADDAYPVEVKFQEDSRIEFYDQSGLSFDSNSKELFKSYNDAADHLKNFKQYMTHVRYFNFYDNGTCSNGFYNQKDADKDAQGKYVGKRVKLHKVEWKTQVMF